MLGCEVISMVREVRMQREILPFFTVLDDSAAAVGATEPDPEASSSMS